MLEEIQRRMSYLINVLKRKIGLISVYWVAFHFVRKIDGEIHHGFGSTKILTYMFYLEPIEMNDHLYKQLKDNELFYGLISIQTINYKLKGMTIKRLLVGTYNPDVKKIDNIYADCT